MVFVLEAGSEEEELLNETGTGRTIEVCLT